MKFTKQQLANWRAYEKVRLKGKWNMFSPAAQVASGLDRDDFMFVMKNYGELRIAVEQDEKEMT